MTRSPPHTTRASKASGRQGAADVEEGQAVKPVRLQLSRRKGFDLQALSIATNGLPAANVARPSAWGNPFSVHPEHKPGRVWNGATAVSVPTRADAVACFAEMMACADAEPGQRAFEMRKNLPELRGKNLACWCRSSEPCHADVLLDLANAPTRCDAVDPPRPIAREET